MGGGEKRWKKVILALGNFKLRDKISDPFKAPLNTCKRNQTEHQGAEKRKSKELNCLGSEERDFQVEVTLTLCFAGDNPGGLVEVNGGVT